MARSFRDLFPSGKPIIAMAHVPPLPGTPLYEDIAAFLQVADGCIVGSDLEVDGYTWNSVDPEGVRRFVRAARG